LRFVSLVGKAIHVAEVARQGETDRKVRGEQLEEAFALYRSELLGTLYYLVGNVEDARDALQEAFIKCWRHRDQVSEVANLKAWIFRIALNTGRDIRQTAWRRKRQALPEDDSVIPSHQSGPQAEAERNEQLVLVERAIGLLRAEEQEVFLLRQNGQLKYEEIAEAVGIPVGTVKTRMRLALAKIREAVSDM
jgi:RNA polymerase sigma-70 factor (ECF subfamily)